MAGKRRMLEEAASQDDEWRTFVAEYGPALSGFFAKRASAGAETVDLVQEVFFRLLRRKKADPISDMRGYVFQVARNVLKDGARWDIARRVNRHEVFDPERHGGSDFSPERVLLAKETLSRLLEAIATLPQRTQDVFVLRALENMKYRDIAELMGISVRAVEKHMAKALAHAGAALDDDA